MKLTNILFFLLTIFATTQSTVLDTTHSNGCVSFTVGSGTGCAWMCNYCATQLGTSNYYFTDGVCTYQTAEGLALSGGCVGNPVAGKQYTCCSASSVTSTSSLEL